MTLTQLEYILAVEQYRHFGRAAKSCSVTQPTLSMQIQKLEDELGEIIFDRSKNPILPTQLGLKIITQARLVIKEHKKIYGLIELDSKELSGSLSLGIIPTLCPYLLPFFLEDFMQEYPNVKLSIKEMQTPDIIKALEDDSLDAAILVTPLKHSQIIERKLFTEQFHIFTSKLHPFFSRKEIKMSDLKGQTPWLLEEGHCLRDQVLNICKIRKISARSDLIFEGGSLETLINLVNHGNGSTLIPEISTFYYSKFKNMIKPITAPTPLREVSIVHSRIFLKEKIIDAVEKSILKKLPNTLISNKNKAQNVVKISL